MPKLYPKKGSRRKAPLGEAFALAAENDPGMRSGAASLFFQQQGGQFATRKFGGRRVKSRFGNAP